MMHDTRKDAEFVIARLEEAGATLLALPGRGCYPAGVKAAWPDVVREFIEAYGYTAEEMRPPTPSAAQISLMDEAYRWIEAIPLTQARPGSQDKHSRHGGAFKRRLVLMRSLVHPITERHVFSWRKMGKLLATNHETVRIWHAQAIDQIVDHLNRSNKINAGNQFFSLTAPPLSTHVFPRLAERAANGPVAQ